MKLDQNKFLAPFVYPFLYACSLPWNFAVPLVVCKLQNCSLSLDLGVTHVELGLTNKMLALDSSRALKCACEVHCDHFIFSHCPQKSMQNLSGPSSWEVEKMHKAENHLPKQRQKSYLSRLLSLWKISANCAMPLIFLFFLVQVD